MERVKILRYTNVAAMVMVAAFNLLDCISNRRGIERYLLFVAPFLVVACIVWFWRNYKTNAVIYGVAGIVIATTGSTGNFSGSIFLIFSIYIFNKPSTTIAMMIATALAITSRYVFMGYTIPDTLNQFVAHAFVFGIYFVLIHPKPPEKPVISRVDDTTIDIVRYLRDGRRPKEIAPLVYMEPGAVYQRLSRARKQFNCGNDEELCKMFDDAGYFGAKPDKAVL